MTTSPLKRFRGLWSLGGRRFGRQGLVLPEKLGGVRARDDQTLSMAEDFASTSDAEP